MRSSPEKRKGRLSSTVDGVLGLVEVLGRLALLLGLLGSDAGELLGLSPGLLDQSSALLCHLVAGTSAEQSVSKVQQQVASAPICPAFETDEASVELTGEAAEETKGCCAPQMELKHRTSSHFSAVGPPATWSMKSSPSLFSHVPSASPKVKFISKLSSGMVTLVDHQSPPS